MAKGGVSKQRTDGGKPGVAGSGAILTPFLKVVEKSADQRSVEIINFQPEWFLALPFSGKNQQ